MLEAVGKSEYTPISDYKSAYLTTARFMAAEAMRLATGRGESLWPRVQLWNVGPHDWQTRKEVRTLLPPGLVTGRAGLYAAVPGAEEPRDELWSRVVSWRPLGLRRTAYRTSASENAFRELANRWRNETSVFSSVTKMAMHAAYQRIIGMGPQAVPLILRELEREPDHWFWALTAITGEDPVPAADAGDVGKMAQAWLRFGRERGWI